MAARRRAGATGAPPAAERAGRTRAASRRTAALSLRLRPRLYHGDEIALGPGKIAVLRSIARTGSLRDAAAALDMSYTRAWALVQTMNACFASPLVATARGGARHGAAHLTPRGRRVLELYEALAAAAGAAAAPFARALRRHLAR
jgi:molybdate transport system regulatory protein